MRRRLCFLVAPLVAFSWGCRTATASGASEDVEFFEKRVRPLLVARCEGCHSAATGKTSGGLALDTRQGWLSGGDSGAVIEPGSPDESLLMLAVSYDAGGPQMPPEEEGGRLADAEIEVLAEWVRRGAPDPRVAPNRIGGMTAEEASDWWSFQPLRHVAPPATAEATSVANEIDRFLQAELEERALRPAPPADRRTLIRRATYDLTGLPPTPDEVEAFVNDSAPDAFAKVVDRLLGSPHYGERWGRHWLDVVRYADTAGENTDRPLPEMWRYRNWLFEAFNRDLPFDEFARLQIAGDVIRAKAEGSLYAEGVIATGYLALARRFGHDIDQEHHLMHEDVIDNLGKGFLGLTLGCARCHDHKYDPLTREDYYAIYGILDSSRFSFSGCEAKGQPRDLVPIVSDKDLDDLKRRWLERRAGGDARVQEIEDRLNPLRETWAEMAAGKQVLAAADVAEAGAMNLADTPSAALDHVAIRRGETLVLVIDPRGNHGADTTCIRWDISEIGGQSRRWSTDDLVAEFPRDNPRAGDGSSAAQWSLLDLQDGPVLLDERVVGEQDQAGLEFWRRGDTPSAFANVLDRPLKAWTELAPKSFFVHPGPNGAVALAWTSPIDGVVSISGSVADAHPAPGLDGVAFSLEHLAAPRSGELLVEIGRWSRERADAIARRDAAAGAEPTPPLAFAVVEGEPRNARVHLQGDPEKLGDEVPRRWLTLFGGQAVPDGSGSGRRELAEWIVDHPLSTRVIVNRVWQGHFGSGLVRTVNDFGSRGESPTHPELLEWLCAQFIADSRRLKPLHRRIMLSAAYQRSSVADETLLEADPENRLLARFDRRRLSAEELRDSLLVVSGQLDRTPGEAHPFPPPETWQFTQHAPFNAVYENSQRTAYQMVQRQRRHPFLALFDGADPNASTGARQTTTVPTQALYFLNDPFFHAQAAALAASLRGLADDTARLRRLFRVALQRHPSTAEQTWADEFLAAYPGSRDERWAACARVVLAGNEFLHID